jgi:hypothetical protein
MYSNLTTGVLCTVGLYGPSTTSTVVNVSATGFVLVLAFVSLLSFQYYVLVIRYCSTRTLIVVSVDDIRGVCGTVSQLR